MKTSEKKKVGAPNHNRKIIEDALTSGKIEKWLRIGYTEKDIYNKLKISRASWYYYKPLISGLIDTFEQFQVDIYEDLLGVAIQSAMGKCKILKEVRDGNGNILKQSVETVPPDARMLHILLYNYGKSKRCVPEIITSQNETDVNEQELEIKKQEFELKKLESERKHSETGNGMSAEIMDWFSQVKR